MDRRTIQHDFENALAMELNAGDRIHLDAEKAYDIASAVSKAVFDALLPGIERAIAQEMNHHKTHDPHVVG